MFFLISSTVTLTATSSSSFTATSSSLIPNSESHAIDPNVSTSSRSTATLILSRSCIAKNVFFLAIPMISTSTSTTPLQFLQNSLNHSPIVPIVAAATAATASLRDKKREIYNKIGYGKAWRKVWSMVYAVTSMAMLISSMVLAAMVAPQAMMVIVAAMRMIGEWFNEL